MLRRSAIPLLLLVLLAGLGRSLCLCRAPGSRGPSTATSSCCSDKPAPPRPDPCGEDGNCSCGAELSSVPPGPEGQLEVSVQLALEWTPLPLALTPELPPTRAPARLARPPKPPGIGQALPLRI